jgi:hypothetical protein
VLEDEMVEGSAEQVRETIAERLQFDNGHLGISERLGWSAQETESPHSGL